MFNKQAPNKLLGWTTYNFIFLLKFGHQNLAIHLLQI